MEVVLFATLIVVVSLSIRLLQETIARKNAVDSLDRVNKSLGDLMVEHSIVRNECCETVDELEAIAKELDEFKDKYSKMWGNCNSLKDELQRRNEYYDSAINYNKILKADLTEVEKERDELKLAADGIRNDFIKDGMWNTVKKVELREKLEIIKAEIDNLITIDLEEK